MNPDLAALAVLLDAARAAYGDDDERVRWLIHPEAVREAMDVPMFDHADGDLYCQGCMTSLHMHLRDEARPCDRLRALDAIDHPRGHEAVALAWDEGARQAPRWRPAPTTAHLRDLTDREIVDRYGVSALNDLRSGRTMLQATPSAALSTPRGSGNWHVEYLGEFPTREHDCRRDGHSFAVGTCEHCGADDPRFTSPRD